MTGTLPGTPAADGFRMPGEFEPHAGCWMLWPERPDNWREAALPAQLAFVQVAAAIAQFEPLTVGCRPRTTAPRVRCCPSACGWWRWRTMIPGCVTSGHRRGECARRRTRRRLALQRLGRPCRGPVFSLGPG